ncbi:hypothetical protein NE237_026388 [Protea cynaroides]|uniref:Agenet domain-containing protein n=1 Tax=Protea cynaroides TaxID=273540 RepID=A0A9Q0H855_9MAGN|nr:hypothetical protein NE237_026388 [Protea cynaroides]
MTRFKKGSKVEVLSKTEVPSGAWRCAEILSGNGHSYDVMYDCPLGATNEGAFNRVSRKAIRPSPPPVEGANDWVLGDLVEVLDNNSWKIAIISKFMGGDCFFVRLLGSPREFIVHRSDLRVRQFWQDNKWIMVGKGYAHCEDGKSKKFPTSRFSEKLNSQVPQKIRKTKLCAGDGPLPVENNCFQESHMVSSRTQKRSHVDALTGANCKLRLVEKDGRRQRLIKGHPSPVLGKGRSWRLVQLASKGPRVLPPFSHCRQRGISASDSLQIRQPTMTSYWKSNQKLLEAAIECPDMWMHERE